MSILRVSTYGCHIFDRTIPNSRKGWKALMLFPIQSQRDSVSALKQFLCELRRNSSPHVTRAAVWGCDLWHSMALKVNVSKQRRTGADFTAFVQLPRFLLVTGEQINNDWINKFCYALDPWDNLGNKNQKVQHQQKDKQLWLVCSVSHWLIELVLSALLNLTGNHWFVLSSSWSTTQTCHLLTPSER